MLSLSHKPSGGSQQEDTGHPCPPHPSDSKTEPQKTEPQGGVMPRGQGAIQASFLKEVVLRGRREKAETFTS